MKASLEWLKEYVDISLPVAEIARRLTMAGLEVDDIKQPGVSWDNVVIGQITAINPHPNADRLTLPSIDLGSEQTEVVCGAPNLKVGLKVAFARVGARLIDAHTGELSTLKPAKIRGIASSGMVCSERELGISDSHEGVLILPDDAPLGTPLADYMGDVVLDVDVTPNRPDFLSILGIAREIGALTGVQAKVDEPAYEETGPDISGQVSVTIEAPDLCPRYAASLVTGVTIAPSPDWMQRRLTACGMRPINNIVDITNYVMLEYGQPLHSFDYDNVAGKKIIVRRAGDGEKFRTLDDVDRVLSDQMLVIADGSQSVAIAGVMGGANSEVTDSTTNILLEAASFNAASVHYTARSLGIPSEASTRFERAIRSDLAVHALRRATQLLVEMGGGQASRGIIDEYPGRKDQPAVPISTADVRRLLGVDVTLSQVKDALTSLGLECRENGADSLTAVAPYWRSDLNITADLVEEVARMIGYDSIPLTMIHEPIPHHEPEPLPILKNDIGRIVTGYGFQEIITYSLTSLAALRNITAGEDENQPEPVRMTNPMSSELECLRTSLRANLLTVMAANLRHEENGIRLYELGKTFLPRPGQLPQEKEMFCALVCGSVNQKSWRGDSVAADFYEAKGIVEGLLGQLDISARFDESKDNGLHPARQAEIRANGDKLGVLGEVHPAVLKNFDIDEPVYLLEIDLAQVLAVPGRQKTFQPINRFPAIYRDQALVLDTGVKYQQVLDIIEKFSLVKQVTVFDVYSGEQVPPGKKSLACRITFQSPDHTLTDKEVDGVEKAMLKRLSGELGATLRK